MPDATTMRVAVYFVDDRERALAEEVLGDTTVRFANVMEGSVDAAGLADLMEAGLVVEELPPDHPPPHRAWDPHDAMAVARLEAQGSQAGLASVGPGGDFYRIRLRGPISREQRRELEALGVDIAAFEPPHSYRTFLTPEQRDQVDGLDYVVAVTTYAFEDKLTPELVALVDDLELGGPALAAGDDAAAAETTLFDCLVHREADLPRIRDLIDHTDQAQVVGTSNLRVRFSAPLDLPLLGALAALPEVRQLTVYRPPTIVGAEAPR